MRLLALLAASNAILGVSAGPALRRQDGSSSASSSSSTTSSTSTSATATNALQMSTLSDGRTTTFEVALPGPTDATTTSKTDDEPTSTTAASGTGETAPVSTKFPKCDDNGSRNPFCQPLNQSDLHVGKQYIVTWNPQFAVNNNFGPNSTFEVKLLWANDSQTETWSSGRLPNAQGHTVVTMEEAWLQGYNVYNMTFVASIFDGKKTEPYDGPTFMLSHAPPNHYPPPPPNKIDKTGLFIGLPLGLAFVAFVVVGLFVGMRKSRTIGLGNIMGRTNRGYGTRKSRRQRLGLGKKGAIRLEERNVPQYSDARGHSRGDSLGSLVSDDGNRPAPGTNHFRDEIERQRAGR